MFPKSETITVRVELFATVRIEDDFIKVVENLTRKSRSLPRIPTTITPK